MKKVTGTVKGTGWPIDGHTLIFDDQGGQFDLIGWEPEDDEAVMVTMFRTETDADICLSDTLDDFEKEWKSGEWEPQGAFILSANQVEVTSSEE